VRLTENLLPPSSGTTRRLHQRPRRPPCPDRLGHRAPGILRVIDDKTVYLRPQAVLLASELLLTLRNLLMKHYQNEKGEQPELQEARQHSAAAQRIAAATR